MLGDVTLIGGIFVVSFTHRLFASCKSFGLIIFAVSKKNGKSKKKAKQYIIHKYGKIPKENIEKKSGM